MTDIDKIVNRHLHDTVGMELAKTEWEKAALKHLLQYAIYEAVEAERGRGPRLYQGEEINGAPEGDYAMMYDGSWEEVDTKEFCTQRVDCASPHTFYGPLPPPQPETTMSETTQHYRDAIIDAVAEDYSLNPEKYPGKTLADAIKDMLNVQIPYRDTLTPERVDDLYNGISELHEERNWFSEFYKAIKQELEGKK